MGYGAKKIMRRYRQNGWRRKRYLAQVKRDEDFEDEKTEQFYRNRRNKKIHWVRKWYKQKTLWWF